MPDLFSNCESTEDLAYINICSGSHRINREIKVFCELLWDKFEEHADTHFLIEFKQNFYERYWEMYLTSSLIDWEYSIESNSHGPDILIEHMDNKIWIEAVASGNGDPIINPDTIPDIEIGIGQLVPEEKIILRLRSSIESKSRVYHNYIRDSIIENDEPYIIALNGAKLNFISNDDIPYILKAVLPIGDYYYNFETEESGITFRDRVIRESGTEIFTNIFLDDNYNHISAILYSNTHAGKFDEEIGSDFILIHNPKAINPVPINIIQNGKVINIETDDESNTFTYRIEHV